MKQNTTSNEAKRHASVPFFKSFREKMMQAKGHANAGIPGKPEILNIRSAIMELQTNVAELETEINKLKK